MCQGVGPNTSHAGNRTPGLPLDHRGTFNSKQGSSQAASVKTAAKGEATVTSPPPNALNTGFWKQPNTIMLMTRSTTF